MPIATFAVTRRVTVTMIACAIVVLGIFALPRLPVALLPNFQPPVVSVTVNYGNVAPEVMESTITRPIENAVSRVSGIDYLQSDSFQGQSQVRAQFKYGVDINVAQVDIQNRSRASPTSCPTIPTCSRRRSSNKIPTRCRWCSCTSPTPTARSATSTTSTPTSSPTSSRRSPAWAAPRSAAARRARSWSRRTKSCWRATGSRTPIIVQAHRQGKRRQPGRHPRHRAARIHHSLQLALQSGEEVGDTIRHREERRANVYLRDVAEVSDSIEEQRIFTRIDERPAIKLNVTAQPDANIVAVADGAYKKVDEIKKRYPTMNFTVVLRAARLHRGSDRRARTHRATRRRARGAHHSALPPLVARHAASSPVSLPVSVLGTLFVMYATGQSINTMTLGGLALAVGSDRRRRGRGHREHFRHLDEGETPFEAARNGTAQILSAVLSSTITVMTVFVPLLLIPGFKDSSSVRSALTVMAGVAIFVRRGGDDGADALEPRCSAPSDARGGERGFGHWFNQRYARFEALHTRA